VPRVSRSRRLLDALLGAREVASIEELPIGWPGRGSGSYRDDDGTHARVHLDDGSTVLFREYAQTNQMVTAYQQKEARVFSLLRDAGLPAPVVLASADGGALLSDAGGVPLEVVRDRAVWGAVGAMLRRLHEVPVADDLWLGDRPWMDPVAYLIRNLRRRGVRPSRDAVALLRGPVADHLATRPRAVCCGAGFSLPGMMLNAAGEVVAWLSLGYYVSIDDPDRDVVGLGVQHSLPEAFYDAYGRRPDPVAEIVNGLLHRRTTDVDAVDDAVARLRELVG